MIIVTILILHFTTLRSCWNCPHCNIDSFSNFRKYLGWLILNFIWPHMIVYTKLPTALSDHKLLKKWDNAPYDKHNACRVCWDYLYRHYSQLLLVLQYNKGKKTKSIIPFTYSNHFLGATCVSLFPDHNKKYTLHQVSTIHTFCWWIFFIWIG